MLAITVWCLLLAVSTGAQSLQDRIDRVRQQRAAQSVAQTRANQPNLVNRLFDIIDRAIIEEATLRDAFAWWSDNTRIPLVIDWDAMTLDGIDPEQRITLNLRNIPARQLLVILMQNASTNTELPESQLIAQLSPHYLRVMTKRQANREPVTRVYDVRDLLMVIPSFTDAPRMDLNEALSNTNSGGSGGGSGSGGGLFGDDNEDRDREPTPTLEERGEQLAQTIRDTIEPALWQANGGEAASIKYLDGRLIVRAPEYVQQRIGIPTIRVGDRTGVGGTYTPSRNPDRSDQKTAPGVAGVSKSSGDVSGVR